MAQRPVPWTPRVATPNCLVGDYVILFKDERGELGMGSRQNYPNFDIAKSAANQCGAEKIGRRVYVAQIVGEYQTQARVVEIGRG